MLIRPETFADAAAIASVVERAFAKGPFTSNTEQICFSVTPMLLKHSRAREK